MIITVTEELVPIFVEVCGWEHVYGSKAVTCLRTYGLDREAHRFYLALEDGAPAAALYVGGGILTVVSSAKVNPDEVVELAKQAKVKEINCGYELCTALRERMEGTTDSAWFMEYRGGPAKTKDPDIVPGEISAIFDVLQRSYSYYREHYQYDTWSADMEAKLAHGQIELYQLVQDGKVVASGCIVSQDDECGIVGSVAVVPECRHQGLGSRMSMYLTARILELGKTPRLMCAYDAVAELYAQGGYEICGRWGELYF